VSVVGKQTTIWLKEHETHIWKTFTEIARREGRSASELIMDFVKDYVAKHTGNPVTPLTRWIDTPDLTLFPTLGEKPDWKTLKRFPRQLLKELKNNAEAYRNTAEVLLIYAEKHDNMHKKLNYRDKNCPYCEEEEV
jgi:hypothetical protein